MRWWDDAYWFLFIEHKSLTDLLVQPTACHFKAKNLVIILLSIKRKDSIEIIVLKLLACDAGRESIINQTEIIWMNEFQFRTPNWLSGSIASNIYNIPSNDFNQRFLGPISIIFSTNLAGWDNSWKWKWLFPIIITRKRRPTEENLRHSHKANRSYEYEQSWLFHFEGFNCLNQLMHFGYGQRAFIHKFLIGKTAENSLFRT